MAPFWGLRMRLKNEMTLKKDNQYEVIIMGDCHNLSSIIPNIIEKNTGLSTFNLATHAENTIFATYLLLNNYLENSLSKPRYLIVGFTPYLFTQNENTILNDNLLVFYDFKKGNFTHFTAAFGLSQSVRFLIPSLKHQEWYIGGAIPFKMSTRKKINKFKQDMLINKGRAELKEDNLPIIRYDQHTGQVTAFYDKYLNKILQLAKDHNVKVLMNIPTMPSQLKTIIDAKGYTEEYSQYLNNLLTHYPNVTVLSPNHLLKANDFYIDEFHLTQKGAIILSNYLSEELNKIAQQ